MSSPFRVSTLQRLLSAEPAELSTTSQNVSSPAFEDIQARRDQSARKLRLALEEIILRYEGDGDEEGDDVIDLELLKVIEDRGQIQSRFGRVAVESQHRFSELELRSSVAQGKQRAVDGEPESAGDPVPHSDATGVEGDDEWADTSDSDSVIFLGSSDAWCASEHPPARDCARQGSSSSAPLSDSTTSLPDRTPTVAHTTDFLTNALFERLKKRVLERASDIKNHRMIKQAADRTFGDPRIWSPLSNTLSTSQMHLISRPLTPNVASPRPNLSSVARIASSLTSSTRTILGTHALRPHPLSDEISGVLSTPATTRTATCTDTSLSSHARLGDSTSKKRYREDTLPTSPFLAPCTSPKSLSVPSTSSPSGNARVDDSCRKLIKPTRLFQNAPPPAQLNKPPKSRPKTRSVAPEPVREEAEGFSSESSEDPLYLPPSTSKKKLAQPCTPASQAAKSLAKSVGMEGLDDELAIELKISSSTSKSDHNRSKKSRVCDRRNFT